MKSKFYTFIFLVIFTGLFSACKTASKLYEKGNYDEAVELAVKKIQKNPNDAEMKSLLQNAYRYAVNDHESRIRNHTSNNSELKWEWLYSEYNSLQRLYTAIRRSPEAFNIVRAADYSSYLHTYAKKAADVRYERGMRWMDKNDKQSFRNAYNEFAVALNFQPGDFEIKSRLDEAYQLAVVNVVILPIENQRSGYRYSVNNNNVFRNFENELLRNLQYLASNHFTKYYSEWDARSRNIRPDQLIDLRFTTFNIGRTRDENNYREVSKDVVIKETVYRPDSIVREYRKVFARITTTRRTMYSTGNLLLNITDENGYRIWSNDYKGTHNWFTEFSSYTGDERALSDSDKQLVNKRQDAVPDEDDIMRHIISEINNNLIYQLKNHFTRY